MIGSGLTMEEMIFEVADTHLFFNDLEVGIPNSNFKRTIGEPHSSLLTTLRWNIYCGTGLRPQGKIRTCDLLDLNRSVVNPTHMFRA